MGSVVASNVTSGISNMGSLTIDAVLWAVERTFEVERADLAGPDKTRGITAVRHFAMLALYQLTDATKVAIGRTLGGRDHSTICAGIAKLNRRMAFDPKIARDLAAVRRRAETRPAPNSILVPMGLTLQLGPCPCQGCGAPVVWCGAGWLERDTFAAHECPQLAVNTDRTMAA